MSDDYVKATGKVLQDTGKAIRFGQPHTEAWIPSSLIVHTSRDLRSGMVTITLPEWKAEELELETT